MDENDRPTVVHIDNTADGQWAAKARSRALQRRADEAKEKRLDAQFRVLEAMPAALSYIEGVLSGQVEPDPERTKISLALIDRVLPKLSAVRVDAAQVAGVDEVATGNEATRAWQNAWLDAAAECSRVWRDRDEEQRRIALKNPQPSEQAGDAIEGSVVPDPED